MDISTTRFGKLAVADDAVLTFVDGLIGMETCRRWVLFGDAHNTALGWLQSLERPEIALAVVHPRRFVAEYQVRISARDIEPLRLSKPSDAHVLVIVNQIDSFLTVNLKAPLVIHMAARLGRQIVARDDHAVQHRISRPLLRKSA